MHALLNADAGEPGRAEDRDGDVGPVLTWSEADVEDTGPVRARPETAAGAPGLPVALGGGEAPAPQKESADSCGPGRARLRVGGVGPVHAPCEVDGVGPGRARPWIGVAGPERAGFLGDGGGPKCARRGAGAGAP